MTPDRVIARLAGRQHQLVARRQLLAAGVGAEAIRHRLETGRLHEQHRGVYSVAVKELDAYGRWLAAVLACGDHAALSHRSAAQLWGLLGRSPGRVHVTVLGRRTRTRRGIEVHATRTLPRAERTHRHRIPVTTVERVLVDLAADPEVERALEQAFALRLIGRTRMREALARANGKRGTKALRHLVARLSDDLPLTRSELERRFLTLLAGAGLPAPEVNRRRAGHRVDFAWPEHGLVVETDGRATHDNPYAFHQDRARDLDLELADLHVIRLSWWQVVDESERVIDLLAKRLRTAARTAP